MASDAQLTTDVLLGDVATFRSGSVFKPDEQGQRSGDIPFIKVSDLNLPSNSHKIEESNNWLTLQSAKRLGTTIHPAGATVFAKIGVALTYNRRRLLIRDTAIDNNLMSAIPNPSKIRPEFLYHTLRCLDFNEIAKGSALPYINIGDLKGLRVRLPSLPEQEEICSLLDALDDRIDLLRQTNATLEAIAQALFKCWFVDFDPVRAKAEGREPEGMDPATAALFPSEFEESELGLIPKGWRAQTFGALLSGSIGGDWGSETPTPDQTQRVAIIRGTDIPDLRSQSPCRVPVRFTTARKLASRALAPGDLVVEVSGGSKDQPTGRSMYVTGQLLSRFDCPVVPASFCRRFSPANERVGLLLAQHMDYIYTAGKTWDYQNQSTGIANFQTTHFLATERVVVPSDPVLDAFFGLVMPIAERVQLKKATILADIRDTLLPRLISGRMRLPQAQHLIEEASA